METNYFKIHKNKKPKKMKNLKLFITIFFGLLIAELIFFLFVVGMVSFANWELLQFPEFNTQTFKNIRIILACNLFGTIVYFPFFKFFGNLTK